MTNAELGIPEYSVRKPRKVVVYHKPQSIIDFETEHTIFKYKGVKHVLYPVRSKFSDNKANELTKLIIEWLKVHGYFGARINTQGNYNAKLGRFVRSGSTKGMADINAVVNGKSVSIEVKIGKDKIRESQIKVKSEIEAAGGVYFIAKNFDNFLEQIKQVINE